MALVADISFTRLLDDFSREGLRGYVEKLAAAFEAWEKTCVRFRPKDPLAVWLHPPTDRVSATQPRIVECRIGECREREWALPFYPGNLPYVVGILWLDNEKDTADDWCSYGDHLIRNAVADTCCNVDDYDHARGFRSSIYLERKLQGVASKIVPSSDPSRVLHIAASVDEVLSRGSSSKEIFAQQRQRKEIRRFLASCDAELMDTWGPSRFSELLAPLGVTLKRWRKVRR